MVPASQFLSRHRERGLQALVGQWSSKWRSQALDPKSCREKSLSRDSKVWGFSASWHGCEVGRKAHVQEGPYELLSVEGSRADAGPSLLTLDQEL